MASDPAIQVRDLGKFYRVYPKPSDLFWELIRRKPMHVEKHVLADVSFDVDRGEVVGVIGANGAGKSTLLSIIAGTLQQSSGDVQIDGTLTAILELGTGFDPEQSGRQNVYLGGIAMGMSRKEVERKLPEIVAFSELEDVIDEPFKTYSSGMQARLTFSTAISVEPDILIIDEALAAGDAAFVQKCLRRVEEIVTSGSTVLLVSHSSTIITRFASRAIWLENGRIVELGDSETVCKHYEIDTYNRVLAYENQSSGEVAAVETLGSAPVELIDPTGGGGSADPTAGGVPSGHDAEDDGLTVASRAQRLGNDARSSAGDQRVRVVDVTIEAESIAEDVFVFGSEFVFHIDVESEIASHTLGLYLAVQRRDDTLMIWTATSHRHLSHEYELAAVDLAVRPGRSRFSVAASHLGLNPGVYFLDVGLEPRPRTYAIADYHDFKPRYRHFSVVHRNDAEELTQVFLSPSSWTATGEASVTPRGSIEADGEGGNLGT
ncbi:MAG: ABC transporter ATP-binding protein [Actinomycetota bacterium]